MTHAEKSSRSCRLPGGEARPRTSYRLEPLLRTSVSVKATVIKTAMAKLNNTRTGTACHSTGIYPCVAATFDKGDNIFVEGTIEQRQFKPKGDGVERTVQEVVVRSCHLIAAPRRTTGAAKASVAEECAVPDLQKGAIDHDAWPAG